MDLIDCCILVVDEDRRQRLDLEAALSRLGYPVVLADGRGALYRHLKHSECAILIVDAGICRADTVAFLEEVRRLDPDLAVIVISDSPSMVSIIATLRGGACDYLPRPYSLDQLRECVDRAAATHELMSSRRGATRPITVDTDGR